MTWKEEYRQYISNGDRESAKKLLLTVIPEEKVVYKYFRGINRDYNTITKPAMWLCNAYYLNDPFDCAFLVNTCQGGIKSNEGYNKQLIRDAESKKMQTTVFTTCFSEKSDSIVMWGHYANNHRGFCVGYSLKQLIDKFDCFPVLYDENLAQHKGEESILQETLTKYKDWEYEQEWRIVQIDELNRGKQGKIIDFVVPKEIFLGCKNNDIVLNTRIKNAKEIIDSDFEEVDGNKLVSYAYDVLKTECFQYQLCNDKFSLRTIIRI